LKLGVNINTTNLMNKIKLLSYRETDRSHLTDKDILKCSCVGHKPTVAKAMLVKHSNFCIPHLIEKIYFDKKKPPQVCLGKPSP